MIVKELIKHLIIKRNQSIINSDESVLLKELTYLYEFYNKNNNTSKLECTCNIDYSNLENEIQNNRCSICDKPLLLE